MGAGIFGISCAWILAKAGYEVDLFEEKSDIMQAASGINQYRIHRGYHYPRSLDTIMSTKNGSQSFLEAYGEEILVKNIDHYYAIAKEGSLVGAKKYLETLQRMGLEHEIVEATVINKNAVSLTVKVKEELFDPFFLKEVAYEKLIKHNVNLFLETKVTTENLTKYDAKIIATYTQNNLFIHQDSNKQRLYQYELCEKLVLDLPREFNNQSIVIMDGPFTCIDPLGNTGKFLMGHVEHAIYKRTYGYEVEPPEEFKPLLNNGIVRNPPITNFEKFIAAGSQFFPLLSKAKHYGSMYTYRTVLPKREHDDARPTLVEQVDETTITVFSAKIPTCIDTAYQVLEKVNTLA